MVKPLIYFDSCIWIGMITAERRLDSSETAAMAGLVNQLDQKEIIVVSSSLINSEVLEADMTEQQKTVFQCVVQRKSVVQLKDPNPEIMQISAKIRNYYKEIKNNNPKAHKAPSVPDTIHIATAIYFECDEFFTLDKNNKPDGCGLLNLESPIAGEYDLKIVKPHVRQAGLSL
ncbi:PIN domain-containing protein [Emcibacter sp.]|uniref:type II toxin-antitoxin system VapC family toxin n=1 Tax=Emcibacter sp. TaxID=1979954 RepID=UPI002AA750F2|nr:PIN domain-containing protein [Emcibacter sp.]